MLENPTTEVFSSADSFVQEVLKDFWTCCVSREVSILSRREVLTGKAKFGITGDGKEVPQVAMARAFKKGDWRSGYYRDQTFMFALGLCTVEDYFAQLYADAERDPFSGGRQMNAHFASRNFDKDGNWLPLKDHYNISADVSCTAGQMARGVGLAYASKFFRQFPKIAKKTRLSDKGSEVCFCNIGDASTSEGVFWEAVNAAGVLQIPMAVSVWDDGYGISVPREFQTTKDSISAAMAGFESEQDKPAWSIYKLKGWDYPSLCEAYEKGIAHVRKTHTPALFHIEELTQPQGHSTSGSHERYKSKDRLAWEKEHDCIRVMRQWIIDSEMASEAEIDEIQKQAKVYVREAKTRAWKNYSDSIRIKLKELQQFYDRLLAEQADHTQWNELQTNLNQLIDPLFADIVKNARQLSFSLRKHLGNDAIQEELTAWLSACFQTAHDRYHTHLYSEGPHSALRVTPNAATYDDQPKKINGFEILNRCFDAALDRNPRIVAFGEDVGHIGDVNQGFAGLQDKYGQERVFDTGIREWTIMGQAIGLGMRGVRAIAEIQYLDYLIYGLEPLSDDLATLRYRSAGQQRAPVIIRTRGHRLEGIWHAGSPLGMMINSLRGIYICVPRNMTQAAGFYNTMLKSDDPAIIVECLNGYRLKEALPNNIGEFTLPLGVPEILIEGSDLTVVTYGSCIRVAKEAIDLLQQHDISVELIDVQTLLPFDLEHRIVSSLKKTNRILFLDEDVPGGATAYMMREVLEVQGGYQYLDSPPVCLSAHEHRPPYGSDGDYFTKPNAEDVFDAVFNLLKETDPGRF